MSRTTTEKEKSKKRGFLLLTRGEEGPPTDICFIPLVGISTDRGLEFLWMGEGEVGEEVSPLLRRRWFPELTRLSLNSAEKLSALLRGTPARENKGQSVSVSPRKRRHVTYLDPRTDPPHRQSPSPGTHTCARTETGKTPFQRSPYDDARGVIEIKNHHGNRVSVHSLLAENRTDQLLL